MATTINSNTTDGIVITPDTSGEIELQANGVTKAKVTSAGLQDANGAYFGKGMYRNLIINGDMSIAQRGTSATGLTGVSYPTIDRFRLGGQTFGTWTMTQDTDVPTGQGFVHSLKLSCTTANASLSADSVLTLQNRIEGYNLQHLKYGTSSAESLTLSFWIKSNKTGTYTFWFNQPDDNRGISPTFTIDTADTWEKKTITIDGDTTGVIDNDNGEGLRCGFFFVAGTNYTSGTLQTSWATDTTANRVSSSQVNLADSTSNYINITGVQLEVGEGASDFEFLPYDVQLARCQRYYTNVIHLQWCGAVYTPNGDTRTQVLPIGTMRASPTLNPSSYSAHSINLGASGNAVNTPTATWNLSVVHAGNNHYSIDTNQNGTVSYASATSVAIVGPHGAGTITCDAEL